MNAIQIQLCTRLHNGRYAQNRHRAPRMIGFHRQQRKNRHHPFWFKFRVFCTKKKCINVFNRKKKGKKELYISCLPSGLHPWLPYYSRRTLYNPKDYAFLCLSINYYPRGQKHFFRFSECSIGRLVKSKDRKKKKSNKNRRARETPKVSRGQ